MSLRSLIVGLGALAAAAPLASAALAAPQILALLSTGAPVQLTCEGAACTAELSAFCLERDRATPEAGTDYRLHAPANVTLLVTGADGTVRELPLGDRARFRSLREMSAVRVTLDRGAYPDAASLALRVEPLAALLPMSAGPKAKAHSTTEIALATGADRALGRNVVDDSPEADAARGLARALNRLSTRRGQSEFGEIAAAAGLAAPMVHACAAEAAEIKAMRERIIGIYGYWTGRSIGQEPSLRSCLEAQHDRVMSRLNERYWQAKQAGY
jgi:hypothetical protein